MRQHFSMIQLWQNTFKSHAQTANEKLIALQHLNETVFKLFFKFIQLINVLYFSNLVKK